MAQILLFTDQPALGERFEHAFSVERYTVAVCSAARLTSELRSFVQQLAPLLIMIELKHLLDHPQLLFFLRSDRTTRAIPIILITDSAHGDSWRAVFGADGYVTASSDVTALIPMIEQVMGENPRSRAVGMQLVD
jgi:CheY-like chemotaxis protein